MKVLNNVISILTVASLAACQGVHDPDDRNPGEPVAPYTLTVDKTTIESDGKDAATLTITDADGLVLTEGDYLRSTSFHIEETDEWRSGMGTENPNRFTSIIDGTYTITAMYGGQKCSNSVTVTSQNRKNYELFHKNVAIYRLTGTWCQYCPYMTEALGNVDAYTKDHSIVMEFHNSDEFSVPYNMAIDLAAFLLKQYGTEDDGYPYCIYSAAEGSGKRTVNDIQRLVKTQLYDHPARTGIKAVSTFADGKLTVDAVVKASAKGKYDLGIAVLKDGCVPSPGAYEDVYNDVVLMISGNFYGLSTDAFTLEADAEKAVTKVCESEKIDSRNCRVVLFTFTEADGKAVIDNAVSFKVGESVDYRYNE